MSITSYSYTFDATNLLEQSTNYAIYRRIGLRETNSLQFSARWFDILDPPP